MSSQHNRRVFMKSIGVGGVVVALGGSDTALAVSPKTMLLPPVEEWLDLKPDRSGIVRFAVDVAVYGHTHAIDPSGRIGNKTSQDYFNIDVRGDTFYVEGALYPGGTIPEPTVVTETRPGRKSRHYQVVWDLGTSKNPRQIVDNLIHLCLVGGGDEAVWFVWLIGSSEAAVGERRPAGGTGPDRRF